ncbi:MAG: mismatch-specific DNA-glycosylase [Acidobacteriota bacterium]
MLILPDYIVPDLKVVFIGYNPGERSAAVQHHFAGRNNAFWRLLFDSGLTSRLFTAEEDSFLIKEGYGLTNIVERSSNSSSDLSEAEMRQGAKFLRQKLALFQPRIACFLGKDIYRFYTGLKRTAPVEYGPVPIDQDIMILFVAPNPSGRNVIKYEQKLASFSQLNDIVLNSQA